MTDQCPKLELIGHETEVGRHFLCPNCRGMKLGPMTAFCSVVDAVKHLCVFPGSRFVGAITCLNPIPGGLLAGSVNLVGENTLGLFNDTDAINSLSTASVVMAIRPESFTFLVELDFGKCSISSGSSHNEMIDVFCTTPDVDYHFASIAVELGWITGRTSKPMDLVRRSTVVQRRM